MTGKNGLSVKDLVTTGIFTALLLVFTMAGGVCFAINPALTFYMPAGSALLCGPVYLLLAAKVKKPGSIAMAGVLMAIVWFATGMHWGLSLGYLLMGAAADFTAHLGGYRDKRLNSLSYMLFALSGTGSYIVFFINPAGWARTMLSNGTEQSYIDAMTAAANGRIMAAMFISALAAAALSALVGCRLLKKQFERAGIAEAGV